MSVLNKKWNIKNNDQGQSLIEKLLNNRGLTDRDRVQFYLYPQYKKGFHNPFLMKDMDKAVERINKAIAAEEKIIVFGDYDVDGISGTAILIKTLQRLGARASYRLPHRMKDGYGLSNAFVEEFAKVGAQLVITVDCGISCKNQIEFAKSFGIDVIITDHHTIPEHLPDQAYAILHTAQPNCPYPFKGLTGAGVAFKLASALLTDRLNPEERDDYLFSLLDLASMGTIADIGPILDENRIIVKYGLEALKNTRWPGLEYLKKKAGIEPDDKLDVSTIGFRLSPRINAAGRIDHPYYSLQLLLHPEDGEKVQMLGDHLEKLNQDRQQMVAKAVEEAEKVLLGQPQRPKIFIASSPDWHVGILGLIAGKVVEKYGIPAMVMQDFGEYLVASVRSPEIFQSVDALSRHKNLLEHFGGHAQAAGFNIKKEQLAAFTEAMTQVAEEIMGAPKPQQDLNIDCELREEDIHENFLKFLEQMEPFGVGNEQPLFLIRNVRPLFLKRVGKEQNHLHFQAQVGSKKIATIGFKLGEHEQLIRESSGINLVCHLEKNEWRGQTHLQLRAIDFEIAGN